MNKERNIIELFEIALNNFDNLFDNMGLCSYFIKLKNLHLVTESEQAILERFIYKHKPRTKRVKFNMDFFWEPYMRLPRKEYLQRMLNTMYKQSHGIYNKEKKVI